MGDCDRMKPHISDYIENSLDPSTKKEFEKVLETSPELQKLTRSMKILKTSLKNMSRYQCTEDFSLKLRQKILNETSPSINRQQYIRYSLVASFVIILFIVAVNLSFQNDQSDTIPAAKGQSDLRIKPTQPVSNPVSETNDTKFTSEGEIEIKTKPKPSGIIDSTSSQRNPENQSTNKNFKYVDQKE